MSSETIKINRAPVMTLWAAVVAERLGFDRQEALTLGKAVAGLNAQSKGQRLGIFEPGTGSAEENRRAARQQEPDTPFLIELMGRSVPVVNLPEGIRATVKGARVHPESVERYLKGKFGEQLEKVRAVLEELAQAWEPEDLARRAYGLYEIFRPEIPEGAKGWGAAGELSLEKIQELTKKRLQG